MLCYIIFYLRSCKSNNQYLRIVKYFSEYIYEKCRVYVIREPFYLVHQCVSNRAQRLGITRTRFFCCCRLTFSWRTFFFTALKWMDQADEKQKSYEYDLKQKLMTMLHSYILISFWSHVIFYITNWMMLDANVSQLLICLKEAIEGKRAILIKVFLRKDRHK